MAQLLGVPINYLALIDAERQWLKSSIGPLQCQMDRGQSFCSHTILRPEPREASGPRKSRRRWRRPTWRFSW